MGRVDPADPVDPSAPDRACPLNAGGADRWPSFFRRPRLLAPPVGCRVRSPGQEQAPMSLKSAVAVAGLLVVAGTGFAGPVPWSFRAPSNESFFPAGATGGITFPNLALQAGGSDIVVARVAEWSIATASSPDQAGGLGYHFDLE